MRNLTEVAIKKINQMLAVLDLPITEMQEQIIRNAITEAMSIAGVADEEVIQMYQAGDISAGCAAFWLDCDQLELRRRAGEPGALGE